MNKEDLKQLERIRRKLEKKAHALGLSELKWVEIKGTVFFVPILPAKE